MLRGQKSNAKAQSLIVRHNVKGTIDQCIRAFEANEENRRIKRHDAIRAYHEVLSLRIHPTQVTEKMLEDLSIKFFELRAPSSMGIAIAHLNTQNPHIHFMISGVEIETGRSTRISREAFASVKVQMQEYERAKYPVLMQSSVAHGKKQKERSMVREREYQLTKRTRTTSDKERIAQAVKLCYSKSLGKEDFIRQLSDAGLVMYSRNGKMQGVESDNRKYRFTTIGYEPNLKDLDVREAAAKDLQAFREQRENKELAREIEDRSESLSDIEVDRYKSEVTQEQVEEEPEIEDTKVEPDYDIDL